MKKVNGWRYPLPYLFSHHPLQFSWYKTPQHVKRGFTLSFSPFSSVRDDGTLNEEGIEERMQLERTEVEDERIRTDPLMELMEMKRKQREQRKRYREKHPEIFL